MGPYLVYPELSASVSARMLLESIVLGGVQRLLNIFTALFPRYLVFAVVL